MQSVSYGTIITGCPVSRPFITVNERTSMRVDELLNELESDQNREQSWGAPLTALRNAWQLHVEQAEQTLLPEAESLLGPTSNYMSR